MIVYEYQGKKYVRRAEAERFPLQGEAFLDGFFNRVTIAEGDYVHYKFPILRELRPDEVPTDAEVARAQAAGNGLYMAIVVLQTRVKELEALASRLKQRAETAEAALAAREAK